MNMALKPVSGNIQEEMNSIPLADGDPQGIFTYFKLNILFLLTRLVRVFP